GGDEGQFRPIGRVERAGLVRRMRDEEPRLAALGRGDPDIASGNEGDLRTGRAERRLGEVRRAGERRRRAEEEGKTHGLDSNAGACRSPQSYRRLGSDSPCTGGASCYLGPYSDAFPLYALEIPDRRAVRGRRIRPEPASRR